MSNCSDRNYIIVSPPFTENVGGVMVLHQLVHELNALGERAFLWPFGRENRKRGPLYRQLRKAKRAVLGPGEKYDLSTELNTPIAEQHDLNDSSIVVYAEIYLGNPLAAKNVVRWLLYRPGLRDPFEFSEDEMFFAFNELSDLPELTGGAPELFLWRINSIYHNEQRTDRDGICFIVRKGDQKARIPETEVPGAIQIDGKSHSEVNKIFNRCHTFYSYDEATMYSQYAAICGCTSVVVPELYEDREEWVKNSQLALYGVAYGLDDIPHAIETRNQVLGLLKSREAMGRDTVKQFIRLTKERF